MLCCVISKHAGIEKFLLQAFLSLIYFTKMFCKVRLTYNHNSLFTITIIVGVSVSGKIKQLATITTS